MIQTFTINNWRKNSIFIMIYAQGIIINKWTFTRIIHRYTLYETMRASVLRKLHSLLYPSLKK